MPRKAEPTVDLAIPIGTTAAAALLQMSAPKLIALTHAGIFHHARNGDGVPVGGKYLLNQAVADYIHYLTHQREHAPRDHYDEARARRALAAAAVSEMRVKQMSGALIEIEPALEAMNAVVMRFRAKVLSVLPRIAKECYGAASPQDAKERSENLAGEIFDELRKLGPEDLSDTSLRVLEATGEQTSD
jgi:hypothetical protein